MKFIVENGHENFRFGLLKKSRGIKEATSMYFYWIKHFPHKTNLHQTTLKISRRKYKSSLFMNESVISA